MTVSATTLAGVVLVTQPTHEDERGFFRQTVLQDELTTALGRSPVFVQSNHTRSDPDVLRGFHLEPWDKLVYVARGTVLAVVVDLRPASPTFRQHLAVRLGDGTERPRLFVPEGVANAYCVLGDEPADYLYDVTVAWRPGLDRTIVRWDDPDLDVDWPVTDPVLAPHDRDAPCLADLPGLAVPG